MYDDRIDIGNIQSGFDDRGGNQHIDLPADKVIHNSFQFSFLHLSVGKRHISLGNQRLNGSRYICNIIDPVIYIVHLAFPRQLPYDGFPDHLLIIFHYISLDRHTVLRSFLQNTHVPDPHQAHMKRSRNRGCRKREHIHVFLQLLDLFLVGHSKSLLLIHHQKSQILKGHICGKYPVGADHNVNHSLFQIVDGLFLLGAGTKSGQQLYSHRELLHPLHQRIIMLLCQYGGRHQKDHLFPLLHSFKGCPNGDLGFSIAHIPADQPVHDPFAFHVLFGRRNGCKLILGLLKRKHFFKFLLPDGVLPILITVFLLSGCIELHKILCHFSRGLPDPALCFVPFLCSQLIELRPFCICGSIFLNNAQSCCQYIQNSAVPVFDLNIVLRDFFYFDLFNPLVNTQSMIFVNHIIPYFQFIKIIDLPAFVSLFLPLFLFICAKDVAL